MLSPCTSIPRWRASTAYGASRRIGEAGRGRRGIGVLGTRFVAELNGRPVKLANNDILSTQEVAASRHTAAMAVTLRNGGYAHLLGGQVALLPGEAPAAASGCGEVRRSDPSALAGASTAQPLLIHCSEEVGHAYGGKAGGFGPGGLWSLLAGTPGARVIAAAGGADKLAIAKQHGADEVIDYRAENLRDRVRDLTGGRGADVVFDPVARTLISARSMV